MNSFCLAFAATAVFVVGTHFADARGLQIGDPAPRLQVMAWIKGKPVTTFVPGHVYVVEFWASWCGPCNRTMPALSAIQKKYAARLTVIGVNAREMEQTEGSLEYITDFVARKADLMAYTVAMDDPMKHPTFDAWMTVAGAYGIPTTFVVDRSGRLAWVGHPSGDTEQEFMQAIAQAVNGTSDLASARATQAALQKETAERLKDKTH